MLTAPREFIVWQVQMAGNKSALVVLKDGRRWRGRVILNNHRDKVVIALSDRSVTFELREVANVCFNYDPQSFGY